MQPKEIEVPADDPFRADLLDRREAVETLTHLVGNLEGPCVLSVDAAWGFGKTTFLKMWTQHLRNQGCPVVDFNAWETDFSEDPFVTLSTELTEGLQSDDRKVPGETIEKLKDASREVLRWLVPGVIRFAASQVPGVGFQLAETAGSFVEDRLSRHSEARTSVDQFREVLQDMAAALSEAAGSRPLMVMIDELDRCRPSYAVELLEVAKHLFSADRIVFVLAVNCDQLAHSVKALYGNDFDAEGYLRRFFDVDFKLPEPDRQAFIDAQLQATGIYDYFAGATRRATGDTIRDLLFLFFGASDLSLRTIGQAIHRLGLLYGSLPRNLVDYGMATAVALILRTMDLKLYARFVTGEASDGDVLDAIFSRPGLGTRRYDQLSRTFEVAVILAGLEDSLPDPWPAETPPSPLLERYRNWDRIDRETSEEEGSEDAANAEEAKHAARVVSIVEHKIQRRGIGIGFGDAVRRLELLSASLIDH